MFNVKNQMNIRLSVTQIITHWIHMAVIKCVGSRDHVEVRLLNSVEMNSVG